MFANGNTVTITEPLADFILDDNNIQSLRDSLNEGTTVICKQFASTQEITQLREHLNRIRLSSLPEFVPITEGARNNYRINFDDERSHVAAFFHVWSFYPWNQDIFSLYERYKTIYHLRNLISGLPKNTFLSRHSEHGCAARLSVQFYPQGKGYFHAHCDPYDKHQLVVPIMVMSQKGCDFQQGGNFIQRSAEDKIDTEKLVEPGDILLFNALMPHGVDTIDPDVTFDPLSGDGRWMMLFAVNKLAGNQAIADAKVVK